ncbi:hypothetical protein CRUP_005333 [Coryphaenoides rupestris]|nr:hypothetical protein CRUP_005333 [Coryphaenoides rupestris]
MDAMVLVWHTRTEKPHLGNEPKQKKDSVTIEVLVWHTRTEKPHLGNEPKQKKDSVTIELHSTKNQ